MIHQEGDFFISSALRELEEERRKDGWIFVLWILGSVLCSALVLGVVFLFFPDPVPLVLGSLCSYAVISFGLWKGNRLRKDYNSKIRRKIMVPLINEWIPEADTVTERSCHSVESLLKAKIVMNLNRKASISFKENSIVRVPAPGLVPIQLSDLEMYHGHGRHSLLLFDGLVAVLKGRFAFEGVGRFQVPKRNWRQFPWLTLVSGFFIGGLGTLGFSFGFSGSAEGLVATLILLCSGVFLIGYASLRYFKRLKIEDNQTPSKKGLWHFDSGFKRFFPNLSPFESKINDFYKRHKTMLIVSLGCEGITIALPQVTDFMEVSIHQSLVKKGLLQKWNLQLTLVKDLVQLTGELVGLLGGVDSNENVLGASSDAMPGLLSKDPREIIPEGLSANVSEDLPAKIQTGMPKKQLEKQNESLLDDSVFKDSE